MEVSIEAFRKRYRYDSETDLLNKSGAANVYKAWDNEQEKYIAIKIYRVDINSNYSLIDEVMRAKKIKHPNLVEYFENYEISTGENDDHGNPISYQVGTMELADRGSLSNLENEGQLSATDVKALTQNLIEGLACLHSNSIPHRHLNYKNILVFTQGDKLVFKINHFGIVDLSDAPVSEAELKYMAPEFFSAATHSRLQITTAADVWSLGAIVCEVLHNNEAPFGDVNKGLLKDEVINNILFKDIEDIKKDLHAPYRDFIDKCFTRNPQTRPASAVVLKELFPELSAADKGKKKSLIITDDAHEKPVPEVKKTEPTPAVEKPKATRQSMIVEEDPTEVEAENKGLRAPANPALRRRYIIGSVLGIVCVAVIAGIALFASKALSAEEQTATTETVDTTVQAASTDITNAEIEHTVETPVEPSVNTATVVAYEPKPAIERRANKNTAIAENKTEKATKQPVIESPKPGGPVAYCFVSLLVYHKPTGAPAQEKKDENLYHFWSNVIPLKCSNGKVKEAIIKYIKAEFPKSRTDYFDGFKDCKVQIFASEGKANSAQIPDRDNSRYPNGNFDFLIDEEDVNIAACK